MIFLMVVLAFAIAGSIQWSLPAWRRHLAAKAAIREECAARGHGPWIHFNMGHNTQFPIRQCSVCGFQEHLDRCLTCGVRIDRETMKKVEPTDDDEVRP